MRVEFETLFPGGVSAHHDYQTPGWILDELPDFDLDPCMSVHQQRIIAPVGFTAEDNGLTKPWFGRVFCNPPYGPSTGEWLRRCADHGNAIALTFARTDTVAFQAYVFHRADAILFIKGRLSFFNALRAKQSNAGAPSCLIAYGKENAEYLREARIRGSFVRLRH